MIWLLCGATHTGKTVLAQRLMEKKHINYLSLDHLKMGLIRSGYSSIAPTDALSTITDAVWPVAREWIRTCLENGQQLAVEGCYIPPDWEQNFTQEQRREMRCICLAMSDAYIRMHFDEIQRHANEAEQRSEEELSLETLLRENAFFRQHYRDPYVIEENYTVEMDALWRKIE